MEVHDMARGHSLSLKRTIKVRTNKLPLDFFKRQDNLRSMCCTPRQVSTPSFTRASTEQWKYSKNERNASLFRQIGTARNNNEENMENMENMLFGIRQTKQMRRISIKDKNDMDYKLPQLCLKVKCMPF